MFRLLPCFLFAIAVLAAGTLQAAEDKTHDGVVISAADGKLVMSDKDGKNEHTHEIGADAKVTLDGKAAKAADLKKGDKVKVTVGEGGKVSAVAATRAKKE